MAATIVAVSDAVSLLLALVDNLASVSQVIKAAQANGQTTLTADQWATITAADDAARAALAKAAGQP